MLKKFVISQIAKIKVSHSIPGRIRFKINSMKMIPNEYRDYQKFLFMALEKLDGITNVDINIITGSVLVNYDTNKVYEKKVIKWIETIKQVGINNYDLIEKYGETNLDFIVKTINQQLDEAIKNI